MKTTEDELKRIIDKCKDGYATDEEFEYIERIAPMLIFVGVVEKKPEKLDPQDD